MRSISRPPKPQFAAEELFYTNEPSSYEQPGDDGVDHGYQQGQYEYFDTCDPNQHDYQSHNEETYTQQDFSPDPDQEGSS